MRRDHKLSEAEASAARVADATAAVAPVENHAGEVEWAWPIVAIHHDPTRQNVEMARKQASWQKEQLAWRPISRNGTTARYSWRSCNKIRVRLILWRNEDRCVPNMYLRQ